MKDMVWYFYNCQKTIKLDNEPATEVQFFERYVDDIFCTVIGEPYTLLTNVNTLHRKLYFTMEKAAENGNLAF